MVSVDLLKEADLSIGCLFMLGVTDIATAFVYTTST